MDPVGRLGFVKFANPDMSSRPPHSECWLTMVNKRSKCVLVVHYSDSNYRHYTENNVTIIELAFVDKVTGLKRI